MKYFNDNANMKLQERRFDPLSTFQTCSELIKLNDRQKL